RAFASFFAFALVFVSIIAPLQTLNQLPLIQKAKAAYMNCVGVVLHNGQYCTSRTELSPGDTIQTGANAQAEIVYPNFSITRFAPQTTVQWGGVSSDQLYLQSGTMWARTVSGSFRVKTDAATTELLRGAVSVSTSTGKRGKTEISGTIPVTVQLGAEHNQSVREQITLLSAERLTIHHNRLRVVKRSTVSPDAWTRKNLAQDKLYEQELKDELAKEHLSPAGALRGNVSDSIRSLAQFAQEKFAYGSLDRFKLGLPQLEEKFRKVFSYAQNGDDAMAMKSFQSYREKIISLVSDLPDKMASEHNELAELFKNHYHFVLLFEPEDPEYVLKTPFQDLAVEIEPKFAAGVLDKIVEGVAGTELREAHRELSEGNVHKANRHLENYAAIIEKSDSGGIDSPQLKPIAKAMTPDDLAILTDIAKKADQLKPKVEALKQQQVRELQVIAERQLMNHQVGTRIMGTAYRGDRADQQTGKVVGQAVKPTVN
ncbi:MAG: FecR domain-containing protein, partial [bacterium]|nr:FecR domain-containing protein [bacterium]